MPGTVCRYILKSYELFMALKILVSCKYFSSDIKCAKSGLIIEFTKRKTHITDSRCITDLWKEEASRQSDQIKTTLWKNDNIKLKHIR